MWLAGLARLDITDAARAVAPHSSHNNPCGRPWVAVEKALVYLNATRDLGVTYEMGSRLSLTAFTDTDCAIKEADRCSISGAVVILEGATVCAISRIQCCVILLTTDAEYLAMAEGVKQGQFDRSVL